MLFSVTLWYMIASYTNGLGWISGAQAPVEFVQSYVSAWKPAWCCWLGWFMSIFGWLFSIFMLWTWKNMPEFDESGIIVEKIKENNEINEKDQMILRDGYYPNEMNGNGYGMQQPTYLSNANENIARTVNDKA